MSDISINNSNTEQAVAELVNKIQTKIIGEGQTSEGRIMNIIEYSAGDFIESLKSEVIRETEIMNSVGELLITMANYIQSASNAFANVDITYNTSRD